MRVIRRPTPDLSPQQSQETSQLWTEHGMVDTTARIFRSQRATEDGGLEMEVGPFQGSLSKVQHSEPVRVTWQTDTVWQENDVTYEVVRPDSAPQTAPPNKCGSVKSSRLPSAR